MDTKQAATSVANDKPAKRERQFGRVYDHEKGTAVITSAFDKDFKGVIDLSQVPEAVLKSFALQGIADYIVNEANATLKEDGQAEALKALDEAVQEVYKGEMDFRSGVGLGGNRSAIAALGAVLWEMGKKKVKDQFGNEYPITDLNSGRAAAKALYTSTKAREWEENGKKMSLTGRQIFNAICEVPEVKAALEAKRKAKEKARVDVSSLME